MKKSTTWILICFCLIGGIALGLIWVAGGLAGKPTVPTSTPNGTVRVFPVNEAHALGAISNAFQLAHYHEMMLCDAIGSDYLEENWHPTNGLVLLPTFENLGSVPTAGLLGSRKLEYSAVFYITTHPLDTNTTRVQVQTISPRIYDGLTIGHSGIVPKAVRTTPVRREEENVLNAIEAQFAPSNERVPTH
ncbi:MAG TPA: hypothetical protein VL527_14115 [Dongiaceae bacterium]|nr:hypothetical protein [Dongiaceae bacterium]